MIAPPDIAKVPQRVHGGKETAIQPPPPLRNELGQRIRHIGLAPRRLHVMEHPSRVALGHKLIAQDAIFGEMPASAPGPWCCSPLKYWASGPLPEASFCRAIPGEDGDISKYGLERFVENVGHLVLKVLGGDKRGNEVDAAGAGHGADLAAGSANVVVDVEGFPEVINGSTARAGADVEEDADVRLENRAEGVKEPAVGVDLLLILFF
ncbi:hypothetical protein BC938DRAFT_476698 [Jimgerdemannia flammicorona]|uniref:Uncharacterized protein n=1 Tax=Jimgerdemannia flammicorona TaxID=994334 RepID=A0A433PF38_9FUNG|nr:hypothetical protein BC938DRAFT_476698 [Jimgerdemannia flammicorona]